MEKKNGRTGMQLLRWSYPFHGRIFETWIENLEKLIPSCVPSRNNRKSKEGSKKRKAVAVNNSDDEETDQGHTGKKVLSVPWHVRTYHGSMYHTQGTGQASKAEKEQTI